VTFQCVLTHKLQGRSQDFTLGDTEAERRRRENPGDEKTDQFLCKNSDKLPRLIALFLPQNLKLKPCLLD